MGQTAPHIVLVDDTKSLAEMYAEFLRAQSRRCGAGSQAAAVAHMRLADCYSALGRVAEALEHARAALRIGRETGDANVCSAAAQRVQLDSARLQ